MSMIISLIISCCSSVQQQLGRIRFTDQWLDPSNLGVQVDIPKGFVPKSFYSERFLSWSIIMPESFIPKGRYSKIQNNDPSELNSSE